MDRHLTVDTLETILLDLRDAPDHLVASLAESWLVEVVLPELVTFYRETSLHFVSPVEDVLGRHLEDLLLLHAEREGDGASLGKILYKIDLVCRPSVQTFLQGGDLKFQVSNREVRDGIRVVEDGELEIFVIHQHVRDVYEETSPVWAGGGQLVLEILLKVSHLHSFTAAKFTWAASSHRTLLLSTPSSKMTR